MGVDCVLNIADAVVVYGVPFETTNELGDAPVRDAYDEDAPVMFVLTKVDIRTIERNDPEYKGSWSLVRLDSTRPVGDHTYVEQLLVLLDTPTAIWLREYITANPTQVRCGRFAYKYYW